MTRLSTHVLDTAAGTPAASLAVALMVQEGSGWSAVAQRVTDADGRVTDLPRLSPGAHRLVFETGSSLFPRVTVEFLVSGEERLHLPLLLSPYGYTVYRGS